MTKLKGAVVVTAENFNEAILAPVRDRMQIVKDASEEDIQQVANATVKDLKSTSPSMKGNYAKGWKFTMHRAADASPYAVISNSKAPGLTHLLEHGHGGPQPAPAKPHIEAAYERGAAELTERMHE